MALQVYYLLVASFLISFAAIKAIAAIERKIEMREFLFQIQLDNTKKTLRKTLAPQPWKLTNDSQWHNLHKLKIRSRRFKSIRTIDLSQRSESGFWLGLINRLFFGKSIPNMCRN